MEGEGEVGEIVHAYIPPFLHNDYFFRISRCMHVCRQKNVKSSNKLAIKRVQVRTVFAGGVNLLN